MPPDAVEGLCARCMARVVFGERSQKSEVRGQRSENGGAGPPAATIRVEVEPDMLLEASGGRIGRYKLLEKIGEGGFGLVYMAEQVEPIGKGGCGVVYMAEQTEPIRRRAPSRLSSWAWTPARSSPASRRSGRRWP